MALVITIIVLVILVGVTLSVTLNSGLISNAKNAVADYNQAQREEENFLAMIEAATDTENTEDNVVETGLISFTIYDQWNGETTRYEAESGMTWGQWVESDYNTDGFFVSDGYIRRRDYFSHDTPVESGPPVQMGERILEGRSYEIEIGMCYVVLIGPYDVPDPDVPLEEPL